MYLYTLLTCPFSKIHPFIPHLPPTPELRKRCTKVNPVCGPGYSIV